MKISFFMPTKKMLVVLFLLPLAAPALVFANVIVKTTPAIVKAAPKRVEKTPSVTPLMQQNIMKPSSQNISSSGAKYFGNTKSVSLTPGPTTVNTNLKPGELKQVNQVSPTDTSSFINPPPVNN